MIFGHLVQICCVGGRTIHIFLEIEKFIMAARDTRVSYLSSCFEPSRKTMLWCIFHELFHVFTLKLVNTIFWIRRCNTKTFQTSAKPPPSRLQSHERHDCQHVCGVSISNTQVFYTNTSSFHYSLSIIINGSGVITKISLENWTRSHQGQV